MKLIDINHDEIYIEPIGTYCGINNDHAYLAYAPLKGVFTIVSPTEAKELVRETRQTDIKSQFLQSTREREELPMLPAPLTIDDIWEVDILMNNICNFHCSYCYSAAGRSNKRLNTDALHKALDFVFAQERSGKLPLKINFSGGGEPLISFPEIKDTIRYIEGLHEKSKRAYSLGLVSNGSLINDEMIEFIKEKRIKLVISFEILPSLQNRERGSYQTVHDNLMKLHEAGCPFGVRSPLTEDALPYLPEMIHALAHDFPFLKSLVVEPVHSPEWYGTPDALKKYYDAFYSSYVEAYKLAENLGIKLVSNQFSLLKYRRKAKCMCKMVVTAEGTISYCARVASSKEPLYEKFIYGDANHSGEVSRIFNRERFTEINKHNIFDQPECQTCFARWNCGGDCSLFHQTYPKECYKVSCDFIKQCLLWEMFERIQKQLQKDHPGVDVMDYVRKSVYEQG